MIDTYAEQSNIGVLYDRYICQMQSNAKVSIQLPSKGSHRTPTRNALCGEQRCAGGYNILLHNVSKHDTIYHG